MNDNSGKCVAVYIAIGVCNFFATIIAAGDFWLSFIFSFIWPLIFVFSFGAVVVAIFSSGAFDGSFADNESSQFLVILTVHFLALTYAWLVVEDEGGVPPGYRFLANFYRHPAHASVERAAGSESSPTFDVAAFEAAIDRNPSRYGRRLQVEELNPIYS